MQQEPSKKLDWMPTAGPRRAVHSLVSLPEIPPDMMLHAESA